MYYSHVTVAVLAMAPWVHPVGSYSVRLPCFVPVPDQTGRNLVGKDRGLRRYTKRLSSEDPGEASACCLPNSLVRNTKNRHCRIVPDAAEQSAPDDPLRSSCLD